MGGKEIILISASNIVLPNKNSSFASIILWKEKNIMGCSLAIVFFSEDHFVLKILKYDVYKINLTRNFFKVLLKQNKIEHLQTEIE